MNDSLRELVEQVPSKSELTSDITKYVQNSGQIAWADGENRFGGYKIVFFLFFIIFVVGKLLYILSIDLFAFIGNLVKCEANTSSDKLSGLYTDDGEIVEWNNVFSIVPVQFIIETFSMGLATLKLKFTRQIMLKIVLFAELKRY